MTLPSSAAFNATWCDFSYSFSRARQPVIEVQEASDALCKFSLSNTDVSVANALRRIMMAEVPTMAVELVNIEENDTVLYDEFIAHRLGLLPLSSTGVGDVPKDDDGYNYAQECSCYDGCQYCTVEFLLDVENKTDVTMPVTHFDIINTGKYKRDGRPTNDVEFLPRPDPGLSQKENIRRNGVLITKLKKHQKMRMVLQAKKGLGKYHAKFNPTSTVVFRYEPVIKLDYDEMATLSLEEKIEFCKRDPRKVFNLDDDGNIFVDKPEDEIFSDECIEFAREELKKPKLVTILHDKNKFNFIVEAVGQRTAPDIVAAALRVLHWKLQKIKMEAFNLDEEDRPIKL